MLLCAQLYRRRADVVLCSAAVFVGLIKHTNYTHIDNRHQQRYWDERANACLYILYTFVRWWHCLPPVIVWKRMQLIGHHQPDGLFLFIFVECRRQVLLLFLYSIGLLLDVIWLYILCKKGFPCFCCAGYVFIDRAGVDCAVLYSYILY